MRAPFTRSAVVLAAALGLVLTAIAAAPASPAATSPAPRVLRVGSWNGIPGSYTSIQAPVDAVDGLERDRGLQGQRRLGPEPQRLQLPDQPQGRAGQRDLVERRRRRSHHRDGELLG